MKRLSTLVTMLVLAVPLPLAATTQELWFHIRSTSHERESGRVSINVPFSIVEKLGPLMSAGDGDNHISINGRQMKVSELRAMWDAVKDKPAATIATIVSDGERVTVQKSGDALSIRSEGKNPNEVRISGVIVAAFLSGRGEELDMPAALRAMATAGAGEILVLRDDQSSVRMWVDVTPDGVEVKK